MLPQKASLTKQLHQHSPLPTRAGQRNLLTTAFSEIRPGSRHCVLLTAVFSASHRRCYFRLRLLTLPQPLAFRLALYGHLSILRRIDSNPIFRRHPPYSADAVSSASSGSLRLWLPADQSHSVRSPRPKPWPLPPCTANTWDAFLNLFRRTCPLYIFSTCNRTAPQFSSYVLPALFHLRLSA